MTPVLPILIILTKSAVQHMHRKFTCMGEFPEEGRAPLATEGIGTAGLCWAECWGSYCEAMLENLGFGCCLVLAISHPHPGEGAHGSFSLIRRSCLKSKTLIKISNLAFLQTAPL